MTNHRIHIPNPDDAIDRIAFMQTQADETLPGYRYERSLSEEELEAERNTYIDESLTLANLEFEKAEYLAELNARIKAVKVKAVKALDLIRTGRIEVVEDVYQIADYDEGKVFIYNQFGDVISSRPFTQIERKTYQRSVFNHPSLNIKTGTD